MPHLFRTHDSKLWKPSTRIPLTLANGIMVEGHWAGSAKQEKLSWWLGPPGNELVQTDEVSAVAIKADDNGEIIWAEAPAAARLFFVLLATEPGKNYRLAKMITTASTPAQIAYFRHERFSLFGHLKPDGSIEKISPLPPPPPKSPAQSELF